MKGLLRPWYRSRLFWLGVPGVVFLVWLSFFSERSFFLTLGDGMSYQFSCEIKSGKVEFFSSKLLGEKTYPLSYFEYGEGSSAPGGIADIPQPLTWREWREERHIVVTNALREIKVAFWFLLVLYLFAWLGFLLWRQRRKVRSTKSEPTLPPRPLDAPAAHASPIFQSRRDSSE